MIDASTTVSPLVCGLTCLFVLAACGDPPEPSAPATPRAAQPTLTPADEAPPTAVVETPALAANGIFWQQLETLCGQAFAGFLTVGTEESDRRFGEANLKMHALACEPEEIRIAFHVDDDRSRTFIIRKSDDRLTLHHRHRDEKGQPADPDGYGGHTVDPGSANRQVFVVDEATVAELPETRYNVWALEVEPDRYLAYELKRVEEERYFRVEFDLQAPIEEPPPPWGE